MPRRRIAFRWTAWLLLAAFVALAGVTAEAWRRQVHRQNEQAFSAQAASVGASVTMAVRRMDDLTLAARTLLAAQPDLTNAEFASWYRSMDVAHRFSGVAGFGYTQIVPRARLKTFAATAKADPTPGNAGAPFQVFPAGARPSYCFSRLGVAAGRTDPVLLELGVPALDLCALSGQLADARDAGRFAALVVSTQGGHDLFEVIAPVYRGGGVPGTRAARRRLATGWVIGLFNAEPILRAAVAGQKGVAVTLAREHSAAEWRVPTGVGGAFRTLADSLQTPTQASYGQVPRGPLLPRRFSVEADGRWIVSVAHAAPPGLSSPTVQAALVLAGWLVVGLLGFFLVQALALGRARALRMVEEKTGQLRHQALHDALTGLPNRALIMDRAERMLARGRRTGTQPAAMFIDLDGFKAVNDTFGHPVGDELLRAVAARIGGVLRETDTIGRLGGDEFVVLVEGEPELVARRILEVLREPFDLGTAHGPVSITTSIGIAAGDRDAARDLLRDADIALYEAKGAGRNRYAEFRHEMHIAAHDRLALQTDLTHAIARGELFLVYQPVLDLETGTVVAAEALLRWQHATRGLVPPAEFIALAEESGLIVDIGAWVLAQACAQTARWRAHGHPIRISVNVSARQFDDPGLLDAVKRALAASGLDGTDLVLEITETALMREADRTAGVLRALKELGVMVAIDDFGTGYSSLAYLQKFPVDALKIDRAFVADEADPLVRTLVQLGRSLNLRTVAEGIEDEAQLAHLRELGCDRGQGYLFAPPLEVTALERFLDQRAALV